MVRHAEAELGRIDILVNNAGALWWKPVLETPVNRFNLVMDINARAPFLCAQAVLPGMIARRWGHIVNMSPPIDLGPVTGRVAYFMSKYGMTLLTHGLAGEVAEHNVAVNSLWPVTLVESQATKGFEMGSPELWRKAEILSDATLAIVAREPRERTGKALLDEDVLREAGITDFEGYNCVEGATPMRIVWDEAPKVG
jgi:citronellol/citronellal dehydrogenase